MLRPKANKSRSSEFDTFAKEYSFWEHTCCFERYKKVLDSLPQNLKMALDLGSGSGSLCFLLANYVQHVVGVEISNSLVSLAKEYQGEYKKNNANFLISRIEHLPFHDHQFDFIVSYRVLHHTDPSKILPILRSLIKPGGRLMVFDYIASSFRLNESSIWHVFQVLKTVPIYYVRYGFESMWRIAKFRTSRAWLRHICSDQFLSLEDFKTAFSEHFPGCEFKNYKGAISALWDAPTTDHVNKNKSHNIALSRRKAST